MAGIAAVFIVNGISVGNQFAGIGITIGIAIASGYLVGLVVSRLGRIKKPYDDSTEFLDA